MLQNYLNIALRTLRRNKIYSFINVTGLAVGMACCTLILLFVRDELSYDRFHKKGDRIVRTYTEVDFNGNVISTMMPQAFAAAAVEDIPGVVDATRVKPEDQVAVRRDTDRFYESGWYATDPSFFSLFDFPLIRGNPATALSEPFSLVITESAARKYFGDEDPLGQTLDVDGKHAYEITGVLQDIPHNSHLQFEFLASFATLEALQDEGDVWAPGETHTYLLLDEGYTRSALEQDAQALLDRRMADYWKVTLHAEPLYDLYLYSELAPQDELSGDPRYVVLFSGIGLLILLIACINYMNLATAQALHRAREIGVRKVIGATRMQLLRQFLGETVLLSLLALVLAAGLAELLTPRFNHLLGKSLPLNYLSDPLVPLMFFGIALFVGLVAGSYPALFVSSFSPATVLKGTVRPDAAGARVRKGLVVFQFVASIVLIVGTLVVQHQLTYVQQKRLGLNPEQVLALTPPDEVKQRYTTFKNEVLQLSNVEHVTTAPLPGSGFWQSVWPEGMTDDQEAVHVSTFRVDDDFLETLEIELAAGRDLSAARASDLRGSVLVNEAAVEAFGWQSGVGKTIDRLDDDFERVTSEVVGVVKNFHNRSLHREIDPIVIQLTESHVGNILVRVRPDDLQQTLDAISATWTTFAPAYPFEYTFVDEAFARLYRSERRLGQLFGAFAFLALLIASLGLFGLAAFMAERRTKEIGIRKVLGATIPSVMLLLSKDFAKLVVIAFVIAAPLAYVAMSRWLENFAYRVEISPGTLLLAGVAVLIVALTTVSYQSIKAALINPVQTLRTE